MIFTIKLKQVLNYFSNIKIFTKINFHEGYDEGWLLIKNIYDTLNNLPENHPLFLDTVNTGH